MVTDIKYQMIYAHNFWMNILGSFNHWLRGGAFVKAAFVDSPKRARSALTGWFSGNYFRLKKSNDICSQFFPIIIYRLISRFSMNLV